jgi:tRNA(Arg) A34 adenosine deaminase TadA
MYDDATLADRFLSVIEHDVVPLTRAGVGIGDKVFGAALLRKSDLSLVLAGTNHETANPLWHGEVHTLKQFYELPDRPDTSELYFVSTHEPCSLCLSAITWAGFDNFFYLFSHEDSRDAFAIPHDLLILSEVFGGGYNRENAFWTSRSLPSLDPSQAPRVAALGETYAELSEIYQASKAGSAIPFA